MVELTDLSFLQSTDIMVPFLFTLAVTFGVLEVTNVFKNKAVNFLIALALSIFAITSPTFVDLLWNYFGDITIFFIVMFLIAFILEALGVRRKDTVMSGDAIVIQSAILFLLLTLGFYYIDKIPSIPFVGGSQNLLLLFALVLILAIFWSAYKLGSGAAPSGSK